LLDNKTFKNDIETKCPGLKNATYIYGLYFTFNISKFNDIDRFLIYQVVNLVSEDK